MIKKEVEIKQIIPSDGWWAVYEDFEDDTGDNTGELLISPLVCWALVTDEEGTYVCGLDESEGMVEPTEYSSNFKFYVKARSEEAAIKEANEIMAEHRARREKKQL